MTWTVTCLVLSFDMLDRENWIPTHLNRGWTCNRNYKGIVILECVPPTRTTTRCLPAGRRKIEDGGGSGSRRTRRTLPYASSRKTCKSLRPKVEAATLYEMNSRTRPYRAQGSYMLGRKCEQSYYQLDRFWLILLTDIDRASREGINIVVFDGVKHRIEYFFSDRSPAEIIYDPK